MITVYGRTNSSNVLKVTWCLGELNLPFELKDLGGPFGSSKDPGYLSLNPNGLVPTLVEDGFVLWESNAIVRYLAAEHGKGTLWPDDLRERASADRWMEWHGSVLGEAMSPMFYGLVRTRPEIRDPAAIAASREAAAAAFAILDRALAGSDHVAGSRFSMGDIPVGIAAYRWFNLPIEREDRPHLKAWYERLCRRPAFRKQVMIGLS
jgi:glutathione S-transferase